MRDIKIISSQRHLDESIIAEKISNKDFEVMISPAFEIDGNEYQVVLDGHHSLEAAKQSNVAPEYYEADCSDHDAICLLDRGEIEAFLEAVHMGDDYYNIENGRMVW